MYDKGWDKVLGNYITLYIPEKNCYIKYFYNGFIVPLNYGDIITKGSFIFFSDKVTIDIFDCNMLSDSDYYFDCLDIRKESDEKIEKIGVYFR